MSLSRRDILRGMVALPLMAPLGVRAVASKQRWLISPILREPQVFGARVAWDGHGAQALHTSAAPLRGHGVLFDPQASHLAWVIARRPGKHAYQYDVRTGEITARISADEDRHFFGHGVFVSNGRYVVTAENDLTTGEGKIVVRDGRNFKSLTEYSSHGIGPHEIVLLADGKTLAVANGGFLSGAENGNTRHREMDSSLVYMDLDSGARLSDYRIAIPRLSLRHLALAADGTIAVAMQYEDRAGDKTPIIAFHRGEVTLAPALAPADIAVKFAGYTASIGCDSASGTFAATHPKGNGVSLWRVRQCFSWVSLPGAAGIVAADGGFVVSSELGALHWVSVDGSSRRLADFPGFKWDNHLYLSPPI